VCFALAFCLTVWFLRRPDQLLRPYIWVEEYKVLDSLQLHGLFRAALAPINGYFVWPTSFTVGLAAAVDFRNVPQIDYWMSTAWFLATLCLVLVPSSNFKLQWRVGFVLLLVLVPTNPEVFGIALYSFWWTTLWPLISVTWAKDNWWLRVPVLVLGGMSSLAGAAMALPYAVLYAKDRRRRDLVGAAVLGATCVAQAVAYFTSARSLQTPVLPLRVALQELRNFADYAFAWLNPTDTGFLGLAGACILLAFLWAVWPDILRRRSSCASELTALVVGLFVVGILSAVPVPLFTNPASAGPRYYFLPFVIFSWALLVIAMTSAVQWARVVAAVMIVASLLALSSDFSRHEDPVSWSAQLARCRTAVGTFSVPVQFTGVASQMWQGLLVITPQTCRRLGYK
jgi:hypothetical protein